MRLGTTIGLSLTALAAIASGVVMFPACTPAETAGPPAVDSGGLIGNYCGTAGKACCASASEFPNPACDDGDESQCKATTGCPIDPSCGDTTTCMPMASNSGGVDNFRMRRLIVVAPPALANPSVQNAVVTGGVDMNEPQCQESQTGDFNWLLSFDTNKNTLTTGGAPPCDKTDTVAKNGFPACDPFTTGYCFVNKDTGTAPSILHIAPATVNLTKASDGTYGTDPIPVLNIPIYFGVPPTIIVLPISHGSLTGVTISPDNNCIGSFNAKALVPPSGTGTCGDSYQNCSKWLTAGSLAGYITLKTANGVFVSLLNQSLCTILTGDNTSADGKHCAVNANGNPTAKGDYCSTTLAAGGCADSFWLAATFAASAVKIDTTGMSNPDCMGGGDSGAPAVDSGTDSGGTTDSGSSDGASE